jgi:hypothetical protein
MPDIEASRSVYVNETGDPHKPWIYEIRGLLEKSLTGFPLPSNSKDAIEDWEDEIKDLEFEIATRSASS